jgi:hypothetical protein
MTQATQQATQQPDFLEEEVPMVELVARSIAGIAIIGEARRILEFAGHTATIVANRITVDQDITAQLTTTKNGGWWQVYNSDGSPPVWTVGTQSEPTNWIGAVEL